MAILGDYISIKHGYAFKGDGISTEDNGIVLVTPGNFAIGGGFKEEKCKFFNDEYPSEYILSADDLIVTMTDLSKNMDTLGYSALVPKSDRVYLHNQRIGLISINREDLDKHYLYWFMRTRNYQRTIAGGASGTTVHHTSPSRICEVEVDFPIISTQKKIAGLLDNIEEKMRLNEEINDNLEQQAQALFKKLFPDVLEDTASDCFESIISFSNGKKRPQSDGSVPVYGGNGILAYTSEVNANNCVVIGRVGAYCGNTFLCQGNCWVSDNAIQAKSKNEDSQIFVYYLLKNASLPTRHIGTGQPLMTQGILNAIPVSVPEQNAINNFIDNVSPMHKLISANLEENSKLAKARDILLPQLMSGELDVSNLDI